MQYLIHRDDQQYGPYSADTIREYLSSGDLSPDDMCWCESMADWSPINTVEEFAAAIPALPNLCPPPPPRRTEAPVSAATETGAQPITVILPVTANDITQAVKNPNTGIRIAPFILGLVCFSMPFMEVSCSHQPMVTMSGAQLVTGTDISNPATGEKKSTPSNFYAIAALLCLLVGLAASFGLNRQTAAISALASALAIFALIFLKADLENQIANQTQGEPVTVSFLYGYWIAILAAVAGLILSLFRMPKGNSS